MSDKVLIYKFKNEHFFINFETCPYCNEKYIETYNYRDCDCVDCGALCPGNAYGCNEPKPIEIKYNTHISKNTLLDRIKRLKKI